MVKIQSICLLHKEQKKGATIPKHNRILMDKSLNTMVCFSNPWTERLPNSLRVPIILLLHKKAYWALSLMTHYHFQTPVESHFVIEGLSSTSTCLSSEIQNPKQLQSSECLSMQISEILHKSIEFQLPGKFATIWGNIFLT